MKDTGNKKLEAAAHSNLGAAYLFLGEYDEAHNYHEDALEIAKAISYRHGEATSYRGLRCLCLVTGKYTEAKEYHEKALTINKEIRDRSGEAENYGLLGSVFQYLGEHGKAEEHFKKAVSITNEIGDVVDQVPVLCKLARLKFSEGKIQEAYSYLLRSVQK